MLKTRPKLSTFWSILCINTPTTKTCSQKLLLKYLFILYLFILGSPKIGPPMLWIAALPAKTMRSPQLNSFPYFCFNGHRSFLALAKKYKNNFQLINFSDVTNMFFDYYEVRNTRCARSGNNRKWTPILFFLIMNQSIIN